MEFLKRIGYILGLFAILTIGSGFIAGFVNYIGGFDAFMYYIYVFCGICLALLIVLMLAPSIFEGSDKARAVAFIMLMLGSIIFLTTEIYMYLY